MVEECEPQGRETNEKHEALVWTVDEGYKPSKREVCGEILRSFKPLRDFGIMAMGTGLLVSIAPYVLPSTIRHYFTKPLKEVSESGNPHSFSFAENFGGTVGLGGGLTGVILQWDLYNHLATTDYSEALTIPVATNVASGVYEIGRHLYKSAQQRIVHRHFSGEGRSLD